jgi:hypothetical protein
MAEPQRKKIKLSLKKELKKDRKDETHQWANAIQNKLEASHKQYDKPVHVTKGLMHRELTGKMSQGGVQTGMYKQRKNAAKKELTLLDDAWARVPFTKRRDNRDYFEKKIDKRKQQLAQARKLKPDLDRKSRQGVWHNAVNMGNYPKKLMNEMGPNNKVIGIHAAGKQKSQQKKALQQKK